MPLVQQTTAEEVQADVGACVAELRGRGVRSIFTVGFCFGGSNSWNQSAQQPDLAGAIGFYGRPMRSEPFISKMKAPLQVMIAGADGATTPEQNQEFLRELDKAGVAHESKVYEGAPHSFFDRTYDQWKDACDDAWRRMLDFVKKNS
jgi:carboxymethylenebutenolidase